MQSGFDATSDYYAEDGKVKFGPLDPQFKEFIVKMRDWYKKGLIDQSFTTLDGKAKETNIFKRFQRCNVRLGRLRYRQMDGGGKNGGLFA
ncbi:MAG: hypothetical protein L6V93_15055 [Clostridiales bacterium]|nr:MAG: hypothetical protein L6V93_15055 [Clostridiales bacterium]